MMNLESSRSHSVFTLHLETTVVKSNGIKCSKQSKINFVDLAGSERQEKTQAEGERLKEAKSINKSLFCLISVIDNLSKKQQSYVNYRDSQLTFYLRDSLGGNSRTLLFANVSSSTL